jgi:hypothetical protein
MLSDCTRKTNFQKLIIYFFSLDRDFNYFSASFPFSIISKITPQSKNKILFSITEKLD